MLPKLINLTPNVQNKGSESVFVKNGEEGEQLIYRTADMKLNKKYTVKWNNKFHILIRRRDMVEFFQFFPN